MKRLLFVNGPMGVGKTAVCQELLRSLQPSAYLDGDWCWKMAPFLVTEETKAMVCDNIVSVLSRFLASPALDHVIFGWVMHRSEIARSILERLELEDVEVRQFTLLCSEDTLRRRLMEDIRTGLRSMDALERSAAYLPLYEEQSTVKIVTDRLSPSEVARLIVEQLGRA